MNFATTQQASRLDSLASQKFGLDTLQMMEISGHQVALVINNYFGPIKGKFVTILAGKGHNGGDGLCAAKYLANWGANIKVVLADSRLKPAAQHQMNTLEKMAIKVTTAPTQIPRCDLIVDALLGYNQIGNPRPPYDSLIDQANILLVPIVSVDNPSGLDGESGKPNEPAIRAALTVTLATIKTGLTRAGVKEFVGKLVLVDIGLPRQIYEDVGLIYPFTASTKNVIL